MREIEYKGIRVNIAFNDAGRNWDVCIPDGDPWWKVIGSVGHAHMTEEEVDERARGVVDRWLLAHGL
jgi:hypothetical protein